jgi:acetyl esterase
VLLFAHGGGWVLSSVQTHDEVCRRLCAATGLAVVSVQYRLAPEAPFPAALDDCRVAYGVAARRAGAAGVVLAGDSAGGHLAAALALQLRDEAVQPQPRAQVLIYPAVDATCAADSHARFADGFNLTAAKMRFFWRQFLGSAGGDEGAAARRAPLVSPLHAANLGGLPPALVLLADADVLHDEGAAYHAALRRAGGVAELREYPRTLHGFFEPDNAACADAVADIAAWLRGVFQQS